MATKLHRRQTSLCVTDKIDSLKPDQQGQLSGINYGASSDCGLVTTALALVSFTSIIIDFSKVLSAAAWAAEPLWPASMLQGSLAFFFRPEFWEELGEREAFLVLGLFSGMALPPDGRWVPIQGGDGLASRPCGASLLIRKCLASEQNLANGLPFSAV